MERDRIRPEAVLRVGGGPVPQHLRDELAVETRLVPGETVGSEDRSGERSERLGREPSHKVCVAQADEVVAGEVDGGGKVGHERPVVQRADRIREPRRVALPVQELPELRFLHTPDSSVSEAAP